MNNKIKNIQLFTIITISMVLFSEQSQASQYIGSFNQGGFSRDITINGDYGYIANGFNGLQIVYLNDPGNIILKETITPDYVQGRSTYNVLQNNNFLYMTDRTGGVLTYDISDPSSPNLLSRIFPEDKSNTLAIYNGILFMGEVSGGMVAFDIQDPTLPVEIGRIKIPNETYPKEAQGMAFKDNFSYVANPWGGLAIVDISDPASMTMAGYYNKPQTAYPGVWDVAVQGDFAFIIAQRYGIQSLDISDPVNPVFASELLLPINYMEGNDSPPLDIKMINARYAAVTNGYDGVYIIDTSDPFDIKIAETIDTVGYAWGVTPHGNRLYIADGYDGIHVFDISEYTAVPLPSSALLLLAGISSLLARTRHRLR